MELACFPVQIVTHHWLTGQSWSLQGLQVSTSRWTVTVHDFQYFSSVHVPVLHYLHEYLVQYSLKSGDTKYQFKEVKVPCIASYWKAWLSHKVKRIQNILDILYTISDNTSWILWYRMNSCYTWPKGTALSKLSHPFYETKE